MIWTRNSFVYTQLRVIWLDRNPGDKDYEPTPNAALPLGVHPVPAIS